MTIKTETCSKHGHWGNLDGWSTHSYRKLLGGARRCRGSIGAIAEHLQWERDHPKPEVRTARAVEALARDVAEIRRRLEALEVDNPTA